MVEPRYRGGATPCSGTQVPGRRAKVQSDAHQGEEKVEQFCQQTPGALKACTFRSHSRSRRSGEAPASGRLFLFDCVCLSRAANVLAKALNIKGSEK